MLNQKTFAIVAGVLFSLFALVHLHRLIWGWQVVIGGRFVPAGASWVILVIFAYLGYTGLRLGLKR